MKKVMLLMLMLVGVLSACNKEKEETPEINFGNSLYTLSASVPVTVDLNLSSPATQTLTIAAKVGGTAVMDEDYTLSASEFVFAAGQSQASITITPKSNYTIDREITLSIVAPSGYKLGSKASTIVLVETKEKVMYSFTRKEGRLMDTADIWVELKGEVSGSAYKTDEDTFLPIEILGSSTAIQGTEYEFQDNVAGVTIPKGNRSAKVTMKLLSLDNGTKRVEMKVKPQIGAESRYYVGSFETLTITLTKQTVRDLVGKWKPVEIINEDNYVAYDIPVSDYAALPKNNGTNDYIEIISTDDAEYLEPHLTGDLKSFFISTQHSLAFDHIRTAFLDFSTEEEYDIPYYKIGGVNKFFSKTKNEAEDRLIGFVLKDQSTLIVYFIDYIPTDFFAATYASYDNEFDDEMYFIAYKFVKVP